MKPKQAFGVAVRVIGLLLMILGLYWLACGVVLKFDPADPPPPTNWHYYVFAGFFLFIGYFLIRGVRLVTKFAFHDEDPDSKMEA